MNQCNEDEQMDIQERHQEVMASNDMLLHYFYFHFRYILALTSLLNVRYFG